MREHLGLLSESLGSAAQSFERSPMPRLQRGRMNACLCVNVRVPVACIRTCGGFCMWYIPCARSERETGKKIDPKFPACVSLCSRVSIISTLGRRTYARLSADGALLDVRSTERKRDASLRLDRRSEIV